MLGLAEAVSFGCGDACLGINPVGDDAASTKRIADAVFNFMTRHQIPTQVVVLSRITTQMEALRRGAPLSMIFQSIAGTQDANDDFGVSRELLEAVYELVAQYANVRGVNHTSITMDDQDVELSAAVVPATQRAHSCVSGRTMRRPKMPSSPTWIRHYSRS